MSDEIKKEGVNKEINQTDKVNQAEEELNKSMYFYHEILEKLGTDAICFKCKNKFEKKDVSQILPVRTCDPGLAVFASICLDCYSKLSTAKK